MCLKLSKHWREPIKKNLNIPKGILKLLPDTEVTFWKVYRRTPSGKIRSPYKPKLSPITRDGYQISNRRLDFWNKLTKTEIHNGAIDKGIHVFTSRAKARQRAGFFARLNRRFSILQVKAKRSDIIAYDWQGGEAVCSKIYVPSQDKTKKGVSHGRVR